MTPGASRRTCTPLGAVPLRDRLVCDAAIAVSALSQARPHARLLAQWLGRDLDVGPCSPWQRRALARLTQGAETYLPALDDFTEAGALAELLHSDDIYTVASGAALGSYDPDNLRVTKGDLNPKEIQTLVSVEAAALISEPHRHILKSDAELARDQDEGLMRGTPYWDPLLKNSRVREEQFLKLLHRAGLLTWRRRVRCQV